MDFLCTSLVKSRLIPFPQYAENASSAYINQSSFQNSEILVINLKFAPLREQIIPHPTQFKPQNKGAGKT